MKLLMVIFLFLCGHFAQNTANDLTVFLSGIEPNRGQIVVSIYNNQDDFLLIGKEYRTRIIKATTSEELVVFKDIPKGVYAVTTYQDRNSDGKMTKSFIGIPKEVFGFSNNYHPLLSAPHFDDCKFEIKSDTTIKIKLKKY